MKVEDTCEIFCFDEEKVEKMKNNINQVDFSNMTQLFKVLADQTRLKIVYSLCMEEELCVCDVANIIGSSMATASHHLRLLRNMGIAKPRKDGKLVFYSINDSYIKQLIITSVNVQ